MKKSKIIILILIILGVLFFVFKGTINDILLLKQYGDTFKHENVANSFRSIYKKYPAASIPKGKESIPLTKGKRIKLPTHFNYKGETLSVAEEIEKRNFTSLLILQNDSLVYQQYYLGNKAEDPVNIFSCTKSIVSLMVGIAYKEGKIKDLSDTASTYSPELKGTIYENVSIQNLLDMASGVQWIEDYDDLESEIVQSILALLKGSLNDFTKEMVRTREQGVFNQYTSMDTQILGMVIEGATHTKLQDYFYNKLWSKLDIEDKAYFLEDKTGMAIAYGGLIISARDMAKIGLMVLHHGKNRKGEQLVDSVWIQQSTKADKVYLQPGKNPNSDYELGYKNQWWLPLESDGGDFSGIGIYGQSLYVNPKRNIVIISNGAYGNYPTDYEGDMRKLTMLQAIAKQIGK